MSHGKRRRLGRPRHRTPRETDRRAGRSHRFRRRERHLVAAEHREVGAQARGLAVAAHRPIAHAQRHVVREDVDELCAHATLSSGDRRGDPRAVRRAVAAQREPDGPEQLAAIDPERDRAALVGRSLRPCRRRRPDRHPADRRPPQQLRRIGATGTRRVRGTGGGEPSEGFVEAQAGEVRPWRAGELGVSRTRCRIIDPVGGPLAGSGRRALAVEAPLLDPERHPQIDDVRGRLAHVIRGDIDPLIGQMLATGGDGIEEGDPDDLSRDDASATFAATASTSGQSSRGATDPFPASRGCTQWSSCEPRRMVTPALPRPMSPPTPRDGHARCAGVDLLGRRTARSSAPSGPTDPPDGEVAARVDTEGGHLDL